MKRAILEIMPGWLLVAIFGLIVLHAPITVVVANNWPDIALVAKSWKELLVLAVAIPILWQYRTKLEKTMRDTVVWLSLAYIALHLVTVLVTNGTTPSIVAGLMIDLRYVAYFLLVYLYLKLYPDYRRLFLKVGAIGAVIVIGFTMVQMVLPRDFLTYLGYSDATIKPYLLLDENPAFVRYNSTLRGPNPLGAYTLIVATICAVYGVVYRGIGDERRWLYRTVFVGALIAAWVSYSRSAWLGLALTLAIIVAPRVKRRPTNRQIVGVGISVVVLCVSTLLLQSTNFYKNVILHDNPTTGAATTSDQGHASSLVDGVAAVLEQPLGGGIGSTGSASLLGNSPLIIENQFLMIAHEVGWPGLGLFVALWFVVLRRLWLARRQGRLSLAVFASGVGLVVISMVWPVLTDDTVSIVWWGLAAISLATKIYKKEETDGAATHKKAKRTA